MHVSSASRLVASLFVLTAAACDAGNKEPRISLTPSATSASIGQGGSSVIIVTVERKNFDGAVNFTSQGAPEGVTVTATPNGLTPSQGSTTVTIAVSGAASPGTSVVVVKASGSGIADQTFNIDLTITVTGNFSLSTLTPNVTMAQGGGGSATVLLPRTGGNAGNVTLAINGLPSGVSGSFAESPTTVTSSVLTLTATTGVAPGTYPATITATSPGLSSQTTPISIVVIAPPSTASVSIPFCSNDLPRWFAYQNEGYNWQQVLPTGSAFNFSATQRVSIAYVYVGGGDTQINVFSVLRDEVSSSNDRDCAGSRSYSGSIAGSASGQTARVTMGTAGASATATTPTFTLNGVAARPLDLVATLGTLSGDYLKPDKMIVRRSLDMGTGATIPVLDFAAAEAFAPAATSLTVQGLLAADFVELQNTFWTTTSTFGAAHSAQLTASASTLYSVPAAQLIAGDLHELYIDASQSTSSQLQGRSYVEYFAAPADRTVQMGPTINVPSITTVTVSPYARVRGVITSQADYGSFMEFAYIQDISSGSRIVLVGTSAAYLGGTPATWDITAPDLTGTAGFLSSWMLEPNQSTVYFVEGFAGRTPLLFGALPQPSEIARLGYRAALTSTSQLYRVREMQRAGRRLPQYLRR